MSKHQLDIDYDYDFDAIGICSGAKEYKVAWSLNQLLEIQLERTAEDMEISTKAGVSKHTLYRYYCDQTHISYELLSNKGSTSYLIPEQRQADFFLILYDNIILNCAEIISKLRSITFVSTAFELDVENLKNKENLITN